MDEMDIELKELIEDYEAERNLRYTYPGTGRPNPDEQPLSEEDQEIYDLVWGDEEVAR